MQKKSSPHSGFLAPRVLIALVLCGAACSIITGTLLGFLRPEEPTKISDPAVAGLTFEERVTYQRAIEDVYWRHRIWPKERPDPKPSLDAVMSQAQLETKVADYLRKSQALEDDWQRPITAKQLQAEMDRMAKHTKQPEVLQELFAALGNDPFVIAECLARPGLAERSLVRFSDERSKQTSRIYSQTLADTAKYSLPTISDVAAGCTPDSWAATSTTNAPTARLRHTAVWNGSEMIVWGGVGGMNLNTGGRYNPSTDTWAATSTTNAPDCRYDHTAVWTGTEMFIWGGVFGFPPPNTGGRYNPSTDTWTATSTTNAPAGRDAPTAVWTGTEMIVWGGDNGSYLNSGGRYNPGADSWTATSTTNAAAGRIEHRAVWTGSEMIFWGGYFYDGNQHYLNTGGRYNPSTDSWTATSTTNVPTGRYSHTAVWTGTEMVVCGGTDFQSYFNTGGRYNPSSDSWALTSTINAPSGRASHTAVWTGSEMIVWGGGFSNTGARYNPGTDNWVSTSTVNAPSVRGAHAAIWTGSEMIVWGGRDPGGSNEFLTNGGRYNPGTDSWITTSDEAPSARSNHTAVWTGSEMIVWGGQFGYRSYLNSGGTYTPSIDNWSATSTTDAPSARDLHTAIWTGAEMIVWGGNEFGFPLNTGARNNTQSAPSTPTPTPTPPIPATGGRYDPSTDSWRATSTTNAPSVREGHTAVWTGTEMIVWGGSWTDMFNDRYFFNSGGRYDPITDSWSGTGRGSGVPDPRDSHSAVWTGTEMIVWGGTDFQSNFQTGGRYNPNTDSWTTTSTANAPTPRYWHTAVWTTGNEMIVWGGIGCCTSYLNTGGRYNPNADSWAATSITNAPTARTDHTAIWSTTEMIIWGGHNDSDYFNTGGRYDPIIDGWAATAITNAPIARTAHTAVWTGNEMIVWGGLLVGSQNTHNGARYCAQFGAPSPTPTATPTATATATATATPCAGRCAPTPRPRLTAPPRP